jgi:hypothetical protein
MDIRQKKGGWYWYKKLQMEKGEKLEFLKLLIYLGKLQK